MTLSFLLLRQIAQLFIVMLLGWGNVRAGVLKSEDSRCLSMILLYLISPCMIISSFQIQRTPELSRMMWLSLLSALVLNALAVPLGRLFRRLFRLNVVEEASVVYSNCGNMVYPLVGAVFGQEWILFVTIFCVVQTVMAWTHGRILVSGVQKASAREIFGNENILAIFVGFLLFLFQIPLPEVVQGAFSMMGEIIGPAAMLIVGMLIAGMDMQALRNYRGIWRPVVLRLIAVPLLLTLLIKYSGLAALAPQGETVLLISLLSAVTPSANIVTQFCQMFGQDARYAGLINAVTMLLCIVTVPLMVALYQL